MIEPTLLGQDHSLHSDTVSLETGCPVTNIAEKGYEFNYLVTKCGIQKEVFSYGVIFYSVLHCTIMHKGVTGKISLMCLVPRLSFLDTTPNTVDNSLTKSENDLPSANSGLSWNITTCRFELPWVPYF